jgi:hypothetical protein
MGWTQRIWKRCRGLIGTSVAALAISLAAHGSHADPVNAFFAGIREQQAAFESFQVIRRFFICGAEAANANLVPHSEAQTLVESGACLRSLLARDAVFDNDGLVVNGEDAIVAAATGVLANARQNVAVVLESPLVLDFVPGRRPGTGEIIVSFGFEVTQEVVAPGPFGNVLGGQVGKFRDQITVRAVQPNEWTVQSLVVRSLSFESGLVLRFPTPFPRFPQTFPDQRGERTQH